MIKTFNLCKFRVDILSKSTPKEAISGSLETSLNLKLNKRQSKKRIKFLPT